MPENKAVLRTTNLYHVWKLKSWTCSFGVRLAPLQVWSWKQAFSAKSPWNLKLCCFYHPLRQILWWPRNPCFSAMRSTTFDRVLTLAHRPPEHGKKRHCTLFGQERIGPRWQITVTRIINTRRESHNPIFRSSENLLKQQKCPLSAI